MYKDDPLSRVLVGCWSKLTPLRRRIRAAASILAHAMESTDTALSSLFGVVALEHLLKEGDSSFAEVEAMACSAVEGPTAREDISRLFSNRHEVSHEAKAPAGGHQHSQEIFTAWAVFAFAAKAASIKLSSVKEFREHLRGRVLARQTGEQLREKGKSELADKVELESTDLGS